MAEIKFVYFDLRARGEPVRLVLAAAGKQWNDVRISFEQWPQEKPSKLDCETIRSERGGRDRDRDREKR